MTTTTTTTTKTLRDGDVVEITADNTYRLQLVTDPSRLINGQIPNGYGFRAYGVAGRRPLFTVGIREPFQVIDANGNKLTIVVNCLRHGGAATSIIRRG